MATYLMFGSYSLGALKEISADRTDKALAVIKKHGGKVRAGYALLGQHDLVLVVELPGTEEAVKTSVALSKLLGIAFTTSPAISVEEFDKLIGEV